MSSVIIRLGGIVDSGVVEETSTGLRIPSIDMDNQPQRTGIDLDILRQGARTSIEGRG